MEGGLLITPWTSPNRSRTMPRAQAMNSLRDELRDEMIDKSTRPEGGAAQVFGQPLLMVIGVMISRFTVNNS